MTDPSTPAMPRDSVCTCLRVRKAARRVTQVYDRHLQPTGLTITQYGLLSHLRSLDGVSIGALAERLVMDPTTLTRTLGPLVRRGLATLEADARDRRSRRLGLTPEGRAAVEAARPAWTEAQRQIEAALGPDDTAALNAALDRVLDRVLDRLAE